MALTVIAASLLALQLSCEGQLTSRSFSLQDPETWPDCECVSIDGPIKYCGNLEALTEVKREIIDRKCEDDCSPEACQRAFYTMMQHHDGCQAGTFDAIYGVFYHEIEWDCRIRCYEDPAPRTGLDTCEYECDDTDQARNAVSTLEGSSCPGDPPSQECKDAFKTLEAYHHVCRGGDRGLLSSYHKFKGEYDPACNPPPRESRSIDCDSAINREAIQRFNGNGAKAFGDASKCALGSVTLAITTIFLAYTTPFV